MSFFRFTFAGSARIGSDLVGSDLLGIGGVIRSPMHNIRVILNIVLRPNDIGIIIIIDRPRPNVN